MKKILAIVLLFNCSIVVAQNSLNLVPMPAEVTMSKGNFTIDKKTILYYTDIAAMGICTQFNNILQEKYGFALPLKHLTYEEAELQKGKNKTITFFLVGKETKELSPIPPYTRIDGSYAMRVDKNYINIMSKSEQGLFFGIQTLMQMLPSPNNKPQTTNNKLTIPQLSISDYPRFSYRGMHLDVCRHFFPVSFIKKYIDYLAAYKFNTFHWHLTDDQGWRIEIKKYPELINIGSKRNGTIIGRYPGKGSDNKPYGGFYTQEEIKEVVQYAKERHIDVIPEIEMPGHSSAAIAAYPWLSCFPEKPTEIPAKMISQKSIDQQKAGRIKLVQETWGVFDDVFCAGKDSTFQFLENVIDEVSTLFPSKYFHLGADECPKTHWKICAACQKRMKKNDLKDEHELQSWFVQRIEKYLNSKGKILIGWDEILEGGLAPNAVVMSWRGEAGGIEAAKQKHQVIMTPGNPVYFDHTQSKNEDSVTIGGYNSLEAVYAYEPIPKELNTEQGKYVLGAQANMWTEYMEYPSKIEYMMFPRMTALSEVLWSPKEKRDWKDFERRLPAIFERLDRQKINYSKAYYDLKATVMPTTDLNGILWKVETKNKDSKIKWTSSYLSSYIGDYTKPLLINESTERMFILLGNDNKTLSSVKQSFSFNKATGKKITLTSEPSKSYPGDGAFTLVNGIQNEKGLARSSEFLGFLGTDMDATIDLGKDMEVSKITLHTLKQNGSWIYLPSQVEVSYIPHYDSTKISNDQPIELVTVDIKQEDDLDKIEIKKEKFCRYIHIRAKNYGIIPSRKPGAGNPAWLFVDEIEVQ
jgi:hexosaminidase